MCKTSLLVQRPRVPAPSAGDLGWSLVRELDPECHSEDRRPRMPQLIIKEGCSCTFWPLSFSQAHKQTRLSFMFKKGNYIHVYVSICKEDFVKDTPGICNNSCLHWGDLNDEGQARAGRRWWESKTGRLPASPQIHQKLIKVWNSSYRATSRPQQKISGLQRDRLSSLKWGRREDRDIKREKTENFWMGACALRQGRHPETRGIPVHRGASLQAGPMGSCGVLENWAE